MTLRASPCVAAALLAGGTVFGLAAALDSSRLPPAATRHWMFGDTLLMSLTNHRCLATKPSEPGPVTITATGPTPARKGGECFKWKALE